MYEAMHAHWRKFGPPVHISVAAYIGITKNVKKATASDIQQKYVGPGGFIH
jgi:hypothetical protein